MERIFRLLSLLNPRLDFHSAYIGLQSTSASVHDNALEFLDNVLKVQLRDMLVPLLDSKVTIAERAQMAQRLVHAKIESQEQAVAELVASRDPWLKSCGAYAIGTLGIMKQILYSGKPRELLNCVCREFRRRHSVKHAGYRCSRKQGWHPKSSPVVNQTILSCRRGFCGSRVARSGLGRLPLCKNCNYTG